MIHSRRILRTISTIICSLFLLVILPQPAALAGMIGTADVLAGEQRAQLQDKVVTFLKREAVREQLVQQGVDATLVEQRVTAMSDQEIQALAGRIDELPAGGDLVGAAVIIFLVLLLTDIMGYTDIFPFVKKTTR